MLVRNSARLREHWRRRVLPSVRAMARRGCKGGQNQDAVFSVDPNHTHFASFGQAHAPARCEPKSPTPRLCFPAVSPFDDADPSVVRIEQGALVLRAHITRLPCVRECSLSECQSQP
eukprot:5822728-Prymnesium_polylepis.2